MSGNDVGYVSVFVEENEISFCKNWKKLLCQ